MTRARRSGVVAIHPGKARRAAATAVSTSRHSLPDRRIEDIGELVAEAVHELAVDEVMQIFHVPPVAQDNWDLISRVSR
jgi:hypothetical protein